MEKLSRNAVLLIIDVQKGFDESVLSNRNNPEAEENIARLLMTWRTKPPCFSRSAHIAITKLAISSRPFW
jgi:nicotinamidase-related amidase